MFEDATGFSIGPPRLAVDGTVVGPVTEGTITIMSTLDATGHGGVTVQLDVPSLEVVGPATRVRIELNALQGIATFSDKPSACPSSGSGCGCDYTGWRPGGD
jgi:hypothetical protein